jgi:hypothetical protein
MSFTQVKLVLPHPIPKPGQDRSTPRPLERSKFRISNIILFMSLEKCGIHTGDVQSTEDPREELVTKN